MAIAITDVMNKALKILHLENDERDADLVTTVLKSRFDSEILVVNEKRSYITALMQFSPDVILSEYKVASFNSAEALHICKLSGMKIPFILVASAVSEGIVAVIKAGADDFILKKDIKKLPVTIINSLEKIECEVNLENQKALNVKEKANAILMAQEEERNQVAFALLENVNQILAASNLYIDCAISEENKRMAFMQNSKKYLLMAIDEIKKLSNVIMPPGEFGLIDSLNNWIKCLKQTNAIDFATKWSSFNPGAISEQLQLTIYRIIQEQLNNIIQHANALHVHIALTQTGDALLLMIKEDGDGFDTSQIPKGYGLQNINTRAEIHTGKMLFESQPGKGSILSLVFQLQDNTMPVAE